ncbi:MAG: hypothetical protein IPP91_11095 [Betaproteobacteria bacterium]|nr:hypothetical protein [Betaproteobacteria bacterium]
MIEKLSGLLHTRDLTIREADFVSRMVAIRDQGSVSQLSDKQLDWLVDLHNKHFG